MKVLIIGSGGREHAIGWRMAESGHELFFTPGNGGTSRLGVNLTSQQAQDLKPDLVVVGPEAPLVEGLADIWRQRGVPVVGPGQAGARLESSKAFAKQFMERNGVPTAKYQVCRTHSEALTALSTWPMPVVIKADGLAGGKGVVIAQDYEEARATLEDMMLNVKFGVAGETVILESYLDGVEASIFVLTDGADYLILGAAKDYKRIGDGDSGLNTGGMGAVSPVAFVDYAMMSKIERTIILPTLRGLKNENINYIGFVFVGIMIVEGDPYVLEYNVRLGDPETQALLPRIDVDFADLLYAAGTGALQHKTYSLSSQAAATVVCASSGYPGFCHTGFEITIQEYIDDTYIFYAGVNDNNGIMHTAGGRVLSVTGLGPNLETAIAKAYQQVAAIQYEGKYYRTDIGQDLKRFESLARRTSERTQND